MENNINYGIDLGTTNSLIAKFIKGEVKVFKDPDGWKETLPSIVGFRKDRILVGDRAKNYMEKDPGNFVGFFKRKMGTSESYKIESINEVKTPVELSSYVLKELKTFINSEETLDSVVITIPASFDMTQSNATREAGKLAGFKQVVLLQEPIAASIAYANMKKEHEMKDGKWIVYDLGGGTFDVAIIELRNGEMTVIGHIGNNFLGGTDFDRIIVENFIIPKLESNYKFTNLKQKFQDYYSDPLLNAAYNGLIFQSEKVKITLSTKTSADIEIIGFKDDNGVDVDMELTITRSEFNDLIKTSIDDTINMVKTLLTKKSLNATDIEYVLMIGGSTYIPLVRQRVGESLQIPVNTEIDPTNAVVIGAAYFAGSKIMEIEKNENTKKNYRISIRSAYSKNSKESEEIFAARITGDIQGLFYRIVREGGGYDSGLKILTEKISEDLPLLKDVFNCFILSIYDSQNNNIETGFEAIGINSGVSIFGQPLSEDICIEVDDYDNEGLTMSELIFAKGTTLPNKKTVTKTLNKNILKGSNDDLIRINVLEGPHTSMPESNKCIGTLTITGNNIKRDVSSGSDLEITFYISDSFELSVSAYLNMADQDFKDIFTPDTRQTSTSLLKFEIDDLSKKINLELEESTKNENYSNSAILKKLGDEISSLKSEVSKISENSVTDEKFKSEDRKREIARQFENCTKDKRLEIAKSQYFNTKTECDELIIENGNDFERKTFQSIENDEKFFLTTNSTLKIKERTSQLKKIINQINWRTPKFLKEIFSWLCEVSPKLNNQTQAKSLIESGKFSIESQNWDRLSDINGELIDLLPDRERKQATTKIGFYK